MSDPRPIGVFDSGVGGLTVLRELQQQLPQESTIYFADLGHFPYGPRYQAQVRHFALNLIRFLEKLDVKIVVIACNTATAAALNTAREVFDIPIIGVITPGAEAAVAVTRNKKVGVISTEGTLQSQEYLHTIREANPTISVFPKAAPKLVDREDPVRPGPAADHDRPARVGGGNDRPGGCRVSATMTGIDFAVPIRTELDDFEERLHATVKADLGPVADAMEQILEAGGKRLRPALGFLAAGLGQPPRLDHVHSAAMAIEFIHNATLIHDDLIDGAPTRRGLRTIHETLGPNPAIIIGDYYFAKGANLMSEIGNPAIDALLSQTVMTICFGEMLQLTSQRRYDQSLEEYYAKIERKTAALLAASTYCGAVLAGLSEARVERIRRFGRYLGMSFQIADDVLDYLATEAEVGKPVGNDLKQGTVTPPVSP